MNTLKSAFAILGKDVLMELRKWKILTSMILFSLLAVVLFHLSLGESIENTPSVAAGILWITFVFAGVLGLNKSFQDEKENRSIDGILLAPVNIESVYLGKTAANFLFLTVSEGVTVLFFAVFFRLDDPLVWLRSLPLILINTLGFCSVGTILAAMAVSTRHREILLPILLYPLIVPLVISGAEGTEALLKGKMMGEITGWLKISAAFDIIYIVVPLLVFESVLKE